MRTLVRCAVAFLLALFLQAANFSCLFAQATGNAGAILGTVTDASGAVIPDATVSIQNPVSGYIRSTTTDNSGQYRFVNVPLNPYHMVITAKGFADFAQDVDVSSYVPVTIKNHLSVGAAATTVTVERCRPHRKRFHLSHRRRPRASSPRSRLKASRLP